VPLALSVHLRRGEGKRRGTTSRARGVRPRSGGRRPDKALVELGGESNARSLQRDKSFRDEEVRRLVIGMGVEVVCDIDLVRHVSRQQSLDVSRNRGVVVGSRGAVPIAVVIHAAQSSVAVRRGLTCGGGEYLGRRGGVVDVQ